MSHVDECLLHLATNHERRPMPLGFMHDAESQSGTGVPQIGLFIVLIHKPRATIEVRSTWSETKTEWAGPKGAASFEFTTQTDPA